MGNCILEKVKQDVPLTNMRVFSTYREEVIVNNTGQTLYMLDSTGMVTPIPNVWASCADPGVYFYKRQSKLGDFTKFNLSGQEVALRPNGYEILKYTIPVKTIQDNVALFVEELGVAIGISDNLLYEKHPHTPQGLAKREAGIKSLYEKSILNAPMRFYINDNRKRISVLYTVVNGRVLELPVANIEEQESKCVISLGCNLGLNSTYNIELNEVFAGNQVFKQEDGYVIYLATTREEANKLVFKAKVTEAVYTEKDLTTYLADATTKLKRQIADLVEELQAAQTREKLLREENLMLRGQLDSYMKIKQTQSDNVYRESIQKSGLEKENVKLEKEKVSACSSNISSASSILKIAAGATVAVAAGVFGVCKTIAASGVLGFIACFL